jgi:plasmid maintenance system killer protein
VNIFKESHSIKISWADRKLEKTCSDDRVATARWGADNWPRLKRRLASLLAAPTLRDMDGVPGNCHQLRADRAGEFAIDLWASYRLILEPDHKPLPVFPDRGLDRARVSAIVIKEVVDYHGK